MASSNNTLQPGVQREVGFFEAIHMGFNQYCVFRGRASRSEFWWWWLFMFIVTAVTSFVPWLPGFAFLALLLPSLGVSARRLHDIGKGAGWLWLWLTGIGDILLIIWACVPSEAAPNRFGDIPNAIPVD
ncbi:MAG: DUF805 domain-containing protein [Bacteroidales bacterium]|nr:DUF805 domain-containing protein [Bacteroidales bacterium]